MILAIETSCDDTCAAVVDGRRALSNVVHTQTEHARYGGVVPEVASRAHLERLDSVVETALSEAGVSLDDVDQVAVTIRPGLIGALLIGVAAAKGLAYARKLPLVPVDHLKGHVAAAYLTEPDLEPPFVALIASGGHTALYSVDQEQRMNLLGETLDDASGEALDKGARMLGLGFPGGPAISKAAEDGDPTRHDFRLVSRIRATWTSVSRVSRRACSTSSSRSKKNRSVRSSRTSPRATKLLWLKPSRASSCGLQRAKTLLYWLWPAGSPPTACCGERWKGNAWNEGFGSLSRRRSCVRTTRP